MQLYLVRHADATPGNPDELRPLSDEGREQARELGERMRDDGVVPDVVLTSPLLRARETGEALARATGSTSEADERLAPGATAESCARRVGPRRARRRRRPPAGLRAHRGHAQRRGGTTLPAGGHGRHRVVTAAVSVAGLTKSYDGVEAVRGSTSRSGPARSSVSSARTERARRRRSRSSRATGSGTAGR